MSSLSQFQGPPESFWFYREWNTLEMLRFVLEREASGRADWECGKVPELNLGKSIWAWWRKEGGMRLRDSLCSDLGPVSGFGHSSC